MELYVVEFWANNPELKRRQVFRHYWRTRERAERDREFVARGRGVHDVKILVYECTLKETI